MVQNRSPSRRSSILNLITAVILTSAIVTVWNFLNYLEISKSTQNHQKIHFATAEKHRQFYKRSSLELLTSSSSLPQTYNLPDDDFTKLIDLDNFEFLINHDWSNSAPSLLVLIHSKPSNEELRRIIRQTWGSVIDKKFKLLFLFGVPNNETEQQVLTTENAYYGDVLQGNFIDSYDNLTYKHVMALKWPIYFCRNAKYIVKCDDDVFINTPRLINYVNNQLIRYKRKKLISCSIWRHPLVFRSNSKFKVSYSEYPDKYYPPFCSGYFILYSPDVVLELYKKAQTSRFFRLDDVHVTGIMARKANLTQTSFEKFILSKKRDIFRVAKKSANQNKFLVGPKQLSPEEIELLWMAVTDI